MEQVERVTSMTKTEDFVQIKERVKSLTAECYKMHKAAWENWPYGEPVKTWFDDDGNFCIEYESGEWYHYNEKGEWW